MELEVRLMQRNDMSRFIEVRLMSRVKKGLVARTSMDYQGTDRRTEQAVMTAGGALAEYLESNYGDSFVISEVVALSGEAFREMMADQSKVTRH